MSGAQSKSEVESYRVGNNYSLPIAVFLRGRDMFAGGWTCVFSDSYLTCPTPTFKVFKLSSYYVLCLLGGGWNPKQEVERSREFNQVVVSTQGSSYKLVRFLLSDFTTSTVSVLEHNSVNIIGGNGKPLG